MKYIQYILQSLGAILLIYGTFNSWVSGLKPKNKSFWTRLDNANAEKEVHEFAIYQASIAIGMLVAISILISAAALFYGLFFSNSVFEIVNSLIEGDKLKLAVSATQETAYLMVMVLVFFAILQLINKKSGNKDDLNQKILIWLIASVLVYGLYLSFAQVIPAVGDITKVINPVFIAPADNFTTDIFEPFAVSVLILLAPVCITTALLYTVICNLDDILPEKYHYYDFDEVSKNLVSTIFVFSVGFIGSCFYTLMSGSIGTILGGVQSSPITFQLVIWNSIFDGVTLYATVALLRWASASWRCRLALNEIDTHIRTITKVMPKSSRPFWTAQLTSIEDIRSLESLDDPELLKKDTGLDSLVALKKLASILGCPNINSLDRALYRIVYEKDSEISLLNYGQVSDVSITFNAERSWFVQTLNEADKASSHKAVLDRKLENEEKSPNSPNYVIDSLSMENYENTLSDSWAAIDRARRTFTMRPVICVFIDLVLAATFSFVAMYLGLYGTPDVMTFAELSSLFIGGFNGKEFTDLGPMFWIMHTTFIPTLVLWLVLLVLMLGAFVISPSVNYFARLLGHEPININDAETFAYISFSKTGSLLAALGTIISIIRKFFA